MGRGRKSRMSSAYISGGCSEAAHSCPSAQWYVKSVALASSAHVSSAVACHVRIYEVRGTLYYWDVSSIP